MERPTERLPDRVTVVEVGPRDGFQMETTLIPTELKVAVIDLLSLSGVPKIETVSFVHPRVIPQMADADEVMARIERRPGTTYSVLVPNLKGLDRALTARADAVRLVVCATETYNRRNVGLSIEESLRQLEEMVARASDAELAVEAVVAVAFGCPFEGEVPEARVVELAKRFVKAGVREVSVADSVGLAHPLQIRRIVKRLRQELPETPLALHLHDTRGLGLANVLAALEEGVATFDSSLGGLGGCPITTVASGNVATEDLVNLCEEMDLETGIDLGPLREASRKMEAFLGRRLPSHVLAAGTREELYAGLGK